MISVRGRGTHLPRLAHDRFDEVIRRAREDDSPFAIKKISIGDDADVSGVGATVLESPTVLDSILTGAKAGTPGLSDQRTLHGDGLPLLRAVTVFKILAKALGEGR